MASPSYTYVLTNATTADASQVMQDFNDILNGVTDGSKDLSISALTVAGTGTFNGNVTLGNATADDITITGSIAATIPIKTDNSFDIGTSSLRMRRLYCTSVYGVPTSTAIAAGDLGEVLTSANGTFTGTAAGNVTTLSITAGRWRVWARARVNPNGNINTDGYIVSVSAVSGTHGTDDDVRAVNNGALTGFTTRKDTAIVGPFLIYIAGTTTYYLVANGDGNSINIDFARIYAQRV